MLFIYSDLASACQNTKVREAATLNDAMTSVTTYYMNLFRKVSIL